MRAKKAVANSAVSLLLEIVTALSGLVLPRLILTHFGSDYNGITASVSRFLGIAVLLRSGVGGVTRAALYAPLAENDIGKISGIVRAAEGCLHRAALAFAAGLFVFAAVYPLVVGETFDWLFTFTLVLILGASVFIRYYFGLTYQILLLADQRTYIDSAFHIAAIVLNLAVCVTLIKAGAGFRAVKLSTAVIFSVYPILISVYVKRRYRLQKNAAPDMSAIKQRWDAFAQQVANYINDNTDVVLLTFFCGLREVSVYSVYVMVTAWMKTLVQGVTGSLDSALGNMLAKNESEILAKSFRAYELAAFSLSTFLFSCTFVLLLPFVSLYTGGVEDADYYRPLFCAVIVAAEYLYCLRLPYRALTYAAGHYRQTKKSAYAEAAINVALSLALVMFLGLPGVAVGTLVAVAYRTAAFVIYLSRNILLRRAREFVKNAAIYLSAFALIVIAARQFVPAEIEKFSAWLVYAIGTSLVSGAVVLAASLIFRRGDCVYLFGKIRRTLTHK